MQKQNSPLILKKMGSREQKRAAQLHQKLQLLRSITNSPSESKRSIILDATKYIEELKEKVERLNQEISSSSGSSIATANCTRDSSLPEVTAEATEKGVMVNVYADGSCPGLLVAVLAAFEELNLNVVEARVSCVDCFSFEAVGAQNEEAEDNIVDTQVVRQSILQAIRNTMDQLH